MSDLPMWALVYLVVGGTLLNVLRAWLMAMGTPEWLTAEERGNVAEALVLVGLGAVGELLCWPLSVAGTLALLTTRRGR